MEEVINEVLKCPILEESSFLGKITSTSAVFAKLAFVPEIHVTSVVS